MIIHLSVEVIADEGVELDRESVITDLRLYLFDFAKNTDYISDVDGGFGVLRVSAR